MAMMLVASVANEPRMTMINEDMQSFDGEYEERQAGNGGVDCHDGAHAG